jgi:hypothetical protein
MCQWSCTLWIASARTLHERYRSLSGMSEERDYADLGASTVSIPRAGIGVGVLNSGCVCTVCVLSSTRASGGYVVMD